MSLQLYLAITAIGGVVLVLGLFSEALRRLPISEPILALSVGIVLGPEVTGVLDLAGWADDSLSLLAEAARLTLAIGLMGVALRLPPNYFRKRWRSLAMMLGPVMVLMWLVSGLLTWLVLGVGVWTALLIGACVTPTDPILASATVAGQFARQNLPARLRHLISGESGANDGLALPLVMLPMLMTTHTTGDALAQWLFLDVLLKVGLAVVLGWLVGMVAGYVLQWTETHEPVSRTSVLTFSLALSLVVLGGARLMNVADVLAVFVAGRGFIATATDRERHKEESVQEAVNQFFILPVFVLLGLALPWTGWATLGWRGPALAIAILLLRRLPAVMGLHRWIPALRQRSNARFAGWFGPIGVAALLYGADAATHTGRPELWAIVSLVVVSSILAHGISAAPAIHAMGRQ